MRFLGMFFMFFFLAGFDQARAAYNVGDSCQFAPDVTGVCGKSCGGENPVAHSDGCGGRRQGKGLYCCGRIDMDGGGSNCKNPDECFERNCPTGWFEDPYAAECKRTGYVCCTRKKTRR